jgi:hypothetical protein
VLGGGEIREQEAETLDLRVIGRRAVSHDPNLQLACHRVRVVLLAVHVAFGDSDVIREVADSLDLLSGRELFAI